MQNSLRQTALQNAPRGRKLIDPYALKIANVPFTAWETFRRDYKKHRELYEPTVCTNIIHSHMVGNAKQLGIEIEGVEYYNPYPKQHMLFIEKRACIRFKKMNDDLKTSNIPTFIQQKLNSRQLDCLQEERLDHIINVGYVPNETWTVYKKIVIVEKYGDQDPLWQITFDSDLNPVEDEYGTIDMFRETVTESTEPKVEVNLKKK